MENKMNFIEPLYERVEAYSKTSLELMKLKVLDKTAGITSTFVSRVAFILMLCMFAVTASIGAALWLGEILGKSYYGFFCVAAFYIVMAGVLYFLLHNWIKKCVSNSIISQMLN
jgi:hypothetical protein